MNAWLQRASLRKEFNRARGRMRNEWQGVPRARFTVRRVLLMALLFSVAFAMIWHLQGNAFVFLVGTVAIGMIAGAAIGVPFERVRRAAELGAIAGFAFFLYAALC